MLKNYLKIALRHLLKHKSYALIKLAGLTIGIASCILVFIYISHEFSYDQFHKNTDQIYRVITNYKMFGIDSTANSPTPLAPAFVNDFPEVVTAVRISGGGSGKKAIKYGYQEFNEKRFYFADPSIFDVFTFPLLKGDQKTALEKPYSIVITEEMAHKYFGDQDPIGKILTCDNKHDFMVTGILKNIPSNSHFKCDFIASINCDNELNGTGGLEDWGQISVWTYILLNKNSSAELLEKKFPDFLKKYYGHVVEEDGGNWENSFLQGFKLQPLSRIHLHSHLRSEFGQNSNPKIIWFYSISAFLILLVASINFTNLSTARSFTRAREIGIRKVLGANRKQLIKQFLSESVLLSCLSLPIAIFLVKLFLPYFKVLVDQDIVIDYSNYYYIILSLTAITIIVGVVSGIFYRQISAGKSTYR